MTMLFYQKRGDVLSQRSVSGEAHRDVNTIQAAMNLSWD